MKLNAPIDRGAGCPVVRGRQLPACLSVCVIWVDRSISPSVARGLGAAIPPRFLSARAALCCSGDETAMPSSRATAGVVGFRMDGTPSQPLLLQVPASCAPCGGCASVGFRSSWGCLDSTQCLLWLCFSRRSVRHPPTHHHPTPIISISKAVSKQALTPPRLPPPTHSPRPHHHHGAQEEPEGEAAR